MTQSGIRPATFRLVAQCLNQLNYRVFLDNVISNDDGRVKPYKISYYRATELKYVEFGTEIHIGHKYIQKLS